MEAFRIYAKCQKCGKRKPCPKPGEELKPCEACGGDYFERLTIPTFGHRLGLFWGQVYYTIRDWLVGGNT